MPRVAGAQQTDLLVRSAVSTPFDCGVGCDVAAASAVALVWAVAEDLFVAARGEFGFWGLGVRFGW